jgi:hypothetical protein
LTLGGAGKERFEVPLGTAGFFSPITSAFDAHPWSISSGALIVVALVGWAITLLIHRRTEAGKKSEQDVAAVHELRRKMEHLRFDIIDSKGQLRELAGTDDQIKALRRDASGLATRGPEALRAPVRRLDQLMLDLRQHLIRDDRDQGSCVFEQSRIAQELEDVTTDVSATLDNWQRR